MVTDDYRAETLERLGFRELYPGAGSWLWHVPGSFGFHVQVTLHGPLFYGRVPEPCDPRFSVYLPHQCDRWEVVDETDPYAALELSRAFIRESRRAYDMLSRVVGMGTSQLVQEEEGNQ